MFGFVHLSLPCLGKPLTHTQCLVNRSGINKEQQKAIEVECWKKEKAVKYKWAKGKLFLSNLLFSYGFSWWEWVPSLCNELELEVLEWN